MRQVRTILFWVSHPSRVVVALHPRFGRNFTFNRRGVAQPVPGLVTSYVGVFISRGGGGARMDIVGFISRVARSPISCFPSKITLGLLALSLYNRGNVTNINI